MKPIVSVVIPARNCSRWLPDCLSSILSQDVDEILEVSVYDDNSTDSTFEVLKSYEPQFIEKKIQFVYSRARDGETGGVGFAKNRAIHQSSGEYLCFLDADDVAAPERVRLQLRAAIQNPSMTLIGSAFVRDPPNSTARYTRWANNLRPAQLYTQAYTSHGPTLIAPTWFCSRKLFHVVGVFKEQRAGFAEDLDFFYRLLGMGGRLLRVARPLLTYRYHADCASFGVSESSIWAMRVAEFERRVLDNWNKFSIWNGGKQGRHFYRSLSDKNKSKVHNFIDVDRKKLAKGYYESWDCRTRLAGCRIPIVDPGKASPPAVICVKLDMTHGQLESFVNELGWEEGVDFYYLN